MQRVLLRKTSQAAISPERAAHLVRALPNSCVVHCEGDNLLADVAVCELENLRCQLKGWIISEQGPPTPVPDTKLKLGS